MNNALHDSLSISKRLKGSGMKDPQAEAVAEAIHGSIENATAHLATKQDLGAVESRLKANISALESRLVWRLFLLFSSTAGLAVAVLRLFPP